MEIDTGSRKAGNYKVKHFPILQKKAKIAKLPTASGTELIRFWHLFKVSRVQVSSMC
jgi:hypothetical protein